MKLLFVIFIVFVVGVIGVFVDIVKFCQVLGGCFSVVKFDVKINVWMLYIFYFNVFYRFEVEVVVVQMFGFDVQKVLKVVDIGIFLWV